MIWNNIVLSVVLPLPFQVYYSTLWLFACAASGFSESVAKLAFPGEADGKNC